MDEKMNKFSLEKKVVIITGTSRGLGSSLAEGLAEAGATVIAFDRSDNDHLKNYCASIGANFKRVKIDLLKASKNDLFNAVDSVVGDFSRVDILVNNAGITRRGAVEDFGETDWEDVIKVNLSVPFYLSQAVARHFIRQGSGKIINVASMLSFQGGVRVPSYAASKHGVVGLTRSFAVGLGPHGINVNAIAPGFMETDLTQPLQADKERNGSIVKRISMGRWGKGEDLKGITIFLASAASDYLNGTVIPVDGGYLNA